MFHKWELNTQTSKPVKIIKKLLFGTPETTYTGRKCSAVTFRTISQSQQTEMSSILYESLNNFIHNESVWLRAVRGYKRNYKQFEN